MDDLDTLFREEEAESTPARADDDLDALFEPEQEKPKKRRPIEDYGRQLADDIHEGLFKTRSGEDVLPTLADEVRGKLEKMTPWERIKWRLANPSSTMEDPQSELRVPQPNRIAIDRFLNRNVDLKGIQEQFGDEYSDSDFRRSVFEQMRARSLGEARAKVEGTGEPVVERIAKALPGGGSAISIVDDQYYKQSKARMDAGEGTALDAKVIAEYERTQQARQARGETLTGTLVDAAASVPKLLVGGPAVAIAGLTAEGSSQRSVQQGGEIYSPSNLGPAAVQNAANVFLLGKASQVAQGFKSLGAKVAGGVLADLTGQQLFDVATGKIDEYLPEAYRLNGKYGIAGQIARGELDDAGRNVLAQALMSGAFTALQSTDQPAKPAQPDAAGQISTVAAPDVSPPVARPDGSGDAVGAKTTNLGKAKTAGEGTFHHELTDVNGQNIGGAIVQVDGKTISVTLSGDVPIPVGDWKRIRREIEASYPDADKMKFTRTTGPNAGKEREVSINRRGDGSETLSEKLPEISDKPNEPGEYKPGDILREFGIGENTGETVAKGDPNFVGLQHSEIDARRAGLNLPETEKRNVGEWEGSMERAKSMTSERADRIIEEIANGRAATQDEKAVVLKRMTEKDNALDKSIDALEKARASGDADAIADAETARNRAIDELDAIGRIASQAGTESGASLNFQKALLARDFSAVRMLARAERANGGERLPTEVKAEVADLSKKLQESQKRVADLEGQVADMASVEQRTGPTNRIKRRVQTGKKLEDAWKEFQKVTQGRLFSGVPDGDSLLAGAKLAKAAIDHGVASAKDFIDWLASKRGRDLTTQESWGAQMIWNKAQQDIRTEQNDRFKQRIEKNPSSSGRVAQELAKDAIERGVSRRATDEGRSARDAVVDDVWNRMLEFDPNISRRQVMDEISGYGDYRQLNKDDLAVELRDIKGQLQQVAKLEDMAMGKAPAKTGVERRTPTGEERDLIKQVNEAKKAGGFDVTDPESQLKSALDAVKTRLRNQIDDLDRQLESGQQTVKTKTKLKYDQEAIELREKRDRLKAEYDAVFADPAKSDAERLAVLKENIKNRNAELERRLREEDFSKPEKKPEVKPDEELLRERVKNKKLREQFDAKLRALEDAKRSGIEKAFRGVYEVGNNVPKTLMSSIDAPLGRQGLFSLLTHPVRTAKALPESWRAFFSDDVAKRAEVKLENMPMYKDGTFQKMGIDFTKQHGEEGFFSKLFDKLPKAINYPGGSERAFRTLLNRVRAETATAMAGSLASKPGGLTAADMKVIGNFVNVTTGRLSAGALKQATQSLNFAFFAPQYTVSRFFTAIGQPIWHMPSSVAPEARRAVAKEYAKAAMAVATAAGLIKAAKTVSNSEEFDVGMDPRSPDFLQARIGNTRIDMTGGLKAWFVLGYRMATGTTVNQEGLTKPADRRDLLSQFAFQKSSPLVSGGLELLTGKDAIGQPVTPAQTALSKVSPVFARDVAESAKDLGLPKALVPWMLGVHGFGINTYSSNEKQVATLYQHAHKTPRPTRSAGMPVEKYREKVKEWQTQKEGAQKLLDRSGKTPEEQRQIYNNQKKVNRLKRVGRDAAAVPK